MTLGRPLLARSPGRVHSTRPQNFNWDRPGMRHCSTRGWSASSAHMLAIRRKCALRPGVGTSAAKLLHSAAKRMHVSACFWTLFGSDTALLPKGGSACLSQSSAGQKTVPVMELRWGRVGHLASVIFSIFEHLHDITAGIYFASICCNRTIDPSQLSVRLKGGGSSYAHIRGGCVQPQDQSDASG